MAVQPRETRLGARQRASATPPMKVLYAATSRRAASAGMHWPSNAPSPDFLRSINAPRRRSVRCTSSERSTARSEAVTRFSPFRRSRRCCQARSEVRSSSLKSPTASSPPATIASLFIVIVLDETVLFNLAPKPVSLRVVLLALQQVDEHASIHVLLRRDRAPASACISQQTGTSPPSPFGLRRAIFRGEAAKNWWRRRESNPRPKTFTRSFYMLIRFQFFSPPPVRSRQGAGGSHPLYLASHPGRGEEPARL